MRHCNVVMVVLLVICSAVEAWADEDVAVYDIPRLDSIVIDGQVDDWGDRGFHVNVLSWADGEFRAASDLEGRFRLGWGERGLIILATVQDDEFLESDDPNLLWQQDSVVVYFSAERNGNSASEFQISPGLDPNHPQLRKFLHVKNQDQPPQNPDQRGLIAAVEKTSGGYVMEVLLPWENVGIEPGVGQEINLQLCINDFDTVEGRQMAIWYPMFGTHSNNKLSYRIHLADEASPAVNMTANAICLIRNMDLVRVVAVKELVGQTVQVRDQEKVLTEKPLSEYEGFACVNIMMPPTDTGRSREMVYVELAGGLTLPVDMRHTGDGLARELLESTFDFQPYVFSGSVFPTGHFAHPLRIEQLIGKYEIELTFYDRDFNEVKRAQTPGRYGAVAKIRTEDGRVLTRYRTLFRQPQPMDWWMYPLQGEITWPDALGISPAVASEQKATLNEMTKNALVKYLDRDEGAAMVLAGLYETQAGDGPATVFDDASARDRQWWVTLKRKLNGNDKRYGQTFVCPQVIDGKPARVLRMGTAAEAGMASDAAEKIDAVLTQWAADSDQGFIVCLAKGGVVFLHKAYGERDGQPMTPQTKSWMASLTKLLQGTSMMMLVDQGLVDLDAPVAEYLPAFRGVEVEKVLTVRHLPTHTAGLWGHWGDNVNDLEHLLAEYYPTMAIGDQFLYNGNDLALASKIIEQITGEALPMFYYNHLVGPLGMNHTAVTNSSYDTQSTAYDMAVVGQMLLNGGSYGDKRFFGPDTLEKMLPIRLDKLLGSNTNQQWGVGCTWMPEVGLSERTFGHGAASAAILRIDPDNDMVISMTRNTAGKNFHQYHKMFFEAIADTME